MMATAPAMLLALIGAAGCATSNIATHSVHPDRAISVAVTAEAGRAGIRGAKLDARQSISLVGRGAKLGTLLVGRGYAARSDGMETSTCFAAFIPAGGKPQVLATMGHGEWEATTCTRVVAIGVVRSAGQPLRIALIHDGSSPNYRDREPIILSFDPCLRSARLDLDAYRKASRAGAQTIAGVRAALR